MCAALTGVSAAHWVKHPVECDALIDREFESTAAVIIFLLYLCAALYAARCIVNAPGAALRARRDERLVEHAVDRLSVALYRRERANSLDSAEAQRARMLLLQPTDPPAAPPVRVLW
jgi:hypothetical protein